LTDLNRPGEAIQEINKSIELNDNVAMFRGRQSLDQDRAVRNTNLARSYQQLGLSEWAFSKAVTAVKHDPYNSSAHLFLQDSYDVGGPFFLNSGQLLVALETEGLLYRLLSPANQNTFSNLVLVGAENLGLTLDYTPMYEMPYGRVIASGGIGAWDGRESIQSHQGWLYGGLPGAAFIGGARYFDDRGFGAVNDFFRQYSFVGGIKWSPTVKGTLTGSVQYADDRFGDLSNRANFSAPVNPSLHTAMRTNLYEFGYHHRFNPQAGFLAYFTHRKKTFHENSMLDIGIPNSLTQALDQEWDNFQFQQHLTIGKHSFIAGFDYYSCNVSMRGKLSFPPPFDIFNDSVDFRPPSRSYSFYLLDYWRLRPNLVAELGLFKDFSKDPVFVAPNTVYQSLWSPRFGVNYQFNLASTRHTLRLALERHLTTHFINQPILVPSEIAGFPWAINANTGSEVRQAGAAWEAQWDPKTFTTLRLNALRISTPDFVTETDAISLKWKRYQASLTLNRILVNSLGLSAGFSGKRFVPDLSFQPALHDYYEINGFLGLSYLNRRGFLAGIRTFLVQQFLENRADNPFALVNLRLGWEFPKKRGLALFEVENLFNRHFFYAIEPRRDIEFSPARRFLFRLAFYF
ncbi:MAG: TonB-dependent receptor, partial [Deltaproteobacteria bacterium]|nr:TonB-dependent receptor [Deltaproteobacteria bacterium]